MMVRTLLWAYYKWVIARYWEILEVGAGSLHTRRVLWKYYKHLGTYSVVPISNTIVLQKLRKPGTTYFDSIAQFEYNGKNVDVYKTNFFNSNFKSTLFITLLKAKRLAKIIGMSIGNKKICFKEKKVILFLVNIYHILLAHFLFSYRYYILCFSEEFCR